VDENYYALEEKNYVLDTELESENKELRGGREELGDLKRELEGKT
jgi:hypothetical protein